jgi:uncharacterized protein YeaO (DUF488 family)
MTFPRGFVVVKIRIKRIYEKPSREDGVRVLVDRVWPRGVSKDEAKLTIWHKEIAPSAALRKWFGHDPDRWDEFRRKYRAELDDNAEEVKRLRDTLGRGTATLLYGAKDESHNQAVVLAEYLRGKGK